MNEYVSGFGVVHKALVNPVKAMKQGRQLKQLNAKNDAHIKGMKTDRNALARTELRDWDRYNFVMGPGKPGETYASRANKYFGGPKPPKPESLGRMNERYDVVTRQRLS